MALTAVALNNVLAGSTLELNGTTYTEANGIISLDLAEGTYQATMRHLTNVINVTLNVPKSNADQLQTLINAGGLMDTATCTANTATAVANATAGMVTQASLEEAINITLETSQGYLNLKEIETSVVGAVSGVKFNFTIDMMIEPLATKIRIKENGVADRVIVLVKTDNSSQVISILGVSSVVEVLAGNNRVVDKIDFTIYATVPVLVTSAFAIVAKDTVADTVTVKLLNGKQIGNSYSLVTRTDGGNYYICKRAVEEFCDSDPFHVENNALPSNECIFKLSTMTEIFFDEGGRIKLTKAMLDDLIAGCPDCPEVDCLSVTFIHSEAQGKGFQSLKPDTSYTMTNIDSSPEGGGAPVTTTENVVSNAFGNTIFSAAVFAITGYNDEYYLTETGDTHKLYHFKYFS